MPIPSTPINVNLTNLENSSEHSMDFSNGISMSPITIPLIHIDISNTDSQTFKAINNLVNSTAPKPKTAQENVVLDMTSGSAKSKRKKTQDKPLQNTTPALSNAITTNGELEQKPKRSRCLICITTYVKNTNLGKRNPKKYITTPNNTRTTKIR